MDKVYIQGLEIDTVIGIHDWERRIRQKVVIDLEMAAHVARAARSEDIADALDYHAVSERVRALVEGSECLLIETLAERVAALVLDEFQVPWLRLRLGKPGALPTARDVGVLIERARGAGEPA